MIDLKLIIWSLVFWLSVIIASTSTPVLWKATNKFISNEKYVVQDGLYKMEAVNNNSPSSDIIVGSSNFIEAIKKENRFRSNILYVNNNLPNVCYATEIIEKIAMQHNIEKIIIQISPDLFSSSIFKPIKQDLSLWNITNRGLFPLRIKERLTIFFDELRKLFTYSIPNDEHIKSNETYLFEKRTAQTRCLEKLLRKIDLPSSNLDLVYLSMDIESLNLQFKRCFEKSGCFKNSNFRFLQKPS